MEHDEAFETSCKEQVTAIKGQTVRLLLKDANPEVTYVPEKRKYADEFDSFDFKAYGVKILGLPRFFTEKDAILEEFCNTVKNELGLNYSRIVIKPKGQTVTLVFSTAEEQDLAIAKLQAYKWKDYLLVGMIVGHQLVYRILKKGGALANGHSNGNVHADHLSLSNYAKVYFEPFSDFPQGYRMKYKWDTINSAMERAITNSKQGNPNLKSWLENQKATAGSEFTCDPLNRVEPKYPFVVHFVVGLNVETMKWDVGMQYVFSRALNCIMPLEYLSTVHPKTVEIARILKPMMVRGKGAEKIEYRLAVMCNANDEQMVTFFIRKPSLTAEKKEELTAEIKSLLIPNSLDLKSVYIAVWSHESAEKSESTGSNSVKIWGEDFLLEKILDVKYKLTPESCPCPFSSGLAETADVLCKAANINTNSVVVFLNLQHPYIFLNIAKRCARIIGNKSNTTFSKFVSENSSFNGIDNVQLHAGKINGMLKSLVDDAQAQEFVFVVEDTNSQLSTSTIMFLRALTKAKKIALVTTNMNFPDLGAYGKDVTGLEAFVPRNVVPIDFTPLSCSVEAIVVLEKVASTNATATALVNPLKYLQGDVASAPKRKAPDGSSSIAKKKAGAGRGGGFRGGKSLTRGGGPRGNMPLLGGPRRGGMMAGPPTNRMMASRLGGGFSRFGGGAANPMSMTLGAGMAMRRPMGSYGGMASGRSGGMNSMRGTGGRGGLNSIRGKGMGGIRGGMMGPSGGSSFRQPMADAWDADYGYDYGYDQYEGGAGGDWMGDDYFGDDGYGGGFYDERPFSNRMAAYGAGSFSGSGGRGGAKMAPGNQGGAARGGGRGNARMGARGGKIRPLIGSTDDSASWMPTLGVPQNYFSDDYPNSYDMNNY